jgi:hypothetical protein
VNKQEEQYVHFVSCTDSLNSAWRILREIKVSPGNSLIGVAFQSAVIEYAKPYATSFGITGRHKLDDKYVPSAHRDLHKQLIDTRNQILAHSDLTVMEAKLHVANISSIGKRAFILHNGIHGTMELTNIDSIIDLIEQTLLPMYAEAKRLEKQLPLTMDAV